MRKLPFLLALLVSLLLVAAYRTLPNEVRPVTSLVPARPLPDEPTEAPPPTSSRPPAAPTTQPTYAPQNASANSLAAAATMPPQPTAPAAEGGAAEAETGSSAVVIPSDHPSISYIGRFDFTDPDNVRFDWPATAIEAAFTGPSITVLLLPADNHFNVVVDGAAYHLVPGNSAYRFNVDARLDRHTIRLTKRTEAYAGTATFRGFVLAEGQHLLSPPAPATRHIEFLGDSITAGYGAGGASAACDFSRETQDVQLTYANVTAEAFGADYSVIAMSGLGAVRNYKEETPTSAQPLMAFYPRTRALAPDSRWSFTGPQPDAVVIYLGTNDFSSTPWPSQETFVNGYVEMMGQLRTIYPQAHIFAMGGPLLFGPGEQYVQAAVAAMQAQGDGAVHFVPIANDLAPSEFGCDYHPNAAGHQRIASQLIPVMAAALDW